MSEAKRGRPPKRNWPAILTDAKTRGVTVSMLAHELGCPYNTVSTAAARHGFDLPNDGRARRWDGIRVSDRLKALYSKDNLRDCSEDAFCDSPVNERIAAALELGPGGNVAPDTLYIVEEFGGGHCKIGISAGNDLQRRVRELQAGNARGLKVVRSLASPEARKLERVLHSRFWKRHVRGEWFAVSGEEIVAALEEESAR